MVKKDRKLTPRQLAVIDDLFEGGLDETEVLARHNVSTRLYRRWLCCEAFAGELRFRIESARRAGELIIARYTPVAAAKLVGLIDSDKPETVRRACLDIMAAARQQGDPKHDISRLGTREAATGDPAPSDDEQPALPPALAGKLLALLAEAQKS